MSAPRLRALLNAIPEKNSGTVTRAVTNSCAPNLDTAFCREEHEGQHCRIRRHARKTICPIYAGCHPLDSVEVDGSQSESANSRQNQGCDRPPRSPGRDFFISLLHCGAL
jgi:hypothetical protein